ncbi:hypothetical protein [Serratia fonticola]|uniref:hypothetical protein n=1 Tax=Serratia fonticola TaxID=47917 RepID=UPI0013790DE3|nr:hypothetical protein [Serratia fonticola]NCG50248.1 hypothetical protein [Serratia fonticola]
MTIAEQIHQHYLTQLDSVATDLSEEARQSAARMLTYTTVSKVKEQADAAGMDLEQALYFALAVLSMPLPADSDSVIH